MSKLTLDKKKKLKKVSKQLASLIVLELIKKGYCEVDLRSLNHKEALK